MGCARVDGGGAGPSGTVVAGVLRDPITHFAVLAGVLFGLNAAIAGDERPVIRIGPASVEAALRDRAALMERPQTGADRREVIAGLTEEEILVREAYRRGFDKSPRVRAQLIQTMRLALSDEPGEPDEAGLRAYYVAHQARFQRPETISLSQVFVRDGDAAPRDLTGEMAGAVRLREATGDDLVRQYGVALAARVAVMEEGRWDGPLRGTGGVYYLRVDARRAPRILGFEEVAGAIAEEWALGRQQEAIRQRVAALGQGYLVIAPAER